MTSIAMGTRQALPLFAIASVLAPAAQAEPLTFSQAIALAEADAPTIEARALEIEAAQRSSIAADQLPDPKLSLSSLDTRVGGPYEPSLRPGRDGFPRTQIGISQDIPNGAKRSARAARANAAIGVAQAKQQLERQDVRLAAALAWTDLYFADQRVKILSLLLARLDDLAATAPARLESGGTRPAQAYEPELLKARLADRRAARVAEREQAAALVTRWTGAIDPEASGAPPETVLDADALATAIERLPTLSLEQAQILEAETGIDIARANKRPDFSVNAAFTRRRPEYGDYVSIGVTVDLPFFAKNRQDPIIDARILEANAARLERQDIERKLRAALSSDLASYRLYRENYQRARETLVPLSKTQADLERVSYAAGRVDLGTALNATIAAAEAQVDLVERQQNMVRTAIRIQYTYDGDVQ